MGRRIPRPFARQRWGHSPCRGGENPCPGRRGPWGRRIYAGHSRRRWKATAEKDVAAKKTLGLIAEADLGEMRHLAIGCVAPEIEGWGRRKRLVQASATIAARWS